MNVQISEPLPSGMVATSNMVSQEEANSIVDHLGGHMGDIVTVLHGLRAGRSVQGIGFPFSLQY